MSVILSDVSWFAREPISEAKLLPQYDELGDVEAEESIPYPLDSVIEIGSMFYTIAYQVDRYNSLPCVELKYCSNPSRKTEKCADLAVLRKRFDELQGKYGSVIYSEDKLEVYYYDAESGTVTAGEILNHIYRFYASAMITDELRAVSETDDGWGYSNKAATALKNGTVLYREEIMGDCMHFEGLCQKGKAKFKVCFGS